MEHVYVWNTTNTICCLQNALFYCMLFSTSTFYCWFKTTCLVQVKGTIEIEVAHQVAAWSAIFANLQFWIYVWITPNMKVDHINDIHYNVQLLTNLTRDAIEDLSSHLTHGCSKSNGIRHVVSRKRGSMLHVWRLVLHFHPQLYSPKYLYDKHVWKIRRSSDLLWCWYLWW